MQRYIPVTLSWPEQGIEFIAPPTAWSQFERGCLPAFAPHVLTFVDALAERMRQIGHADPDLAAFGFWLRPAALRQQAARLQGRAPVGMVFHLVPSNVPMVAFYSWMMALLMGNSSVVRLSSRLHTTQERMLSVLNELFADPHWAAIANRTRFIRYPHANPLTGWLSASCRLRIIWGGDEAIRQIRAVPLSAQAQELVFADRRSVAVIDSQWLVQCDETQWHRLILALQQDCCRFNQQACSSPTTFIWLGAPAPALRQRFLCAVFAPFANDPGMTMQRLVNAQRHLCEGGEGQLELLPVVTILTQAATSLDQLHYPGGGVICERVVSDLPALLACPLAIQTCLWIGGERDHLLQGLQENPDCQIDRVVTPGQALAFDWYWDGKDLLQSCSRCIR